MVLKKQQTTKKAAVKKRVVTARKTTAPKKRTIKAKSRVKAKSQTRSTKKAPIKKAVKKTTRRSVKSVKSRAKTTLTAREKLNKKAVNKFLQEKELKPYQAELIQVQQYLEQTKKKMIIIFEGRDASGKGGTIRRVSRYMNEKHYRIVALGKPTENQRTQWYFQKYVEHFPRGGEIVMFDRSWYNRAMVEPVFGFCTSEEYNHFMKGVVGFEKDLVRQGTILVKLYFSVTKEEQKKRFTKRKTDPLRQWKLSEVDLQAQDRWDDFTSVKYEMLKRSHTSAAPWTIIRSNNKHAARKNVMKVLLNAIPYEGANQELDYVPDPDVVISGAREIELMEAIKLKKGKFIA